MHKNTTKYNRTQRKWFINKHGASKKLDTFETYHPSSSTAPATRALEVPCRRLVSIEEAEKVAGLIGRQVVESIGLDDISMEGIWPDSDEFWSKARAEIA
jgi:hypothetical protein